jgi:hypothetical protein
VDRRRQASIVGGVALAGGLGVGVATGSVVAAAIAALAFGVLAVPVAIGEQKVLGWSWALLSAEGELSWWDTKTSVGVIDVKAEPVVHVVRLRTRSKVGRRTNVRDHWVVGAGEVPRLRGEEEGQPTTADWSQVAGLRLPFDDEVARSGVVEALGRFTEVRQLEAVLLERRFIRGLTPTATVEGLPE